MGGLLHVVKPQHCLSNQFHARKETSTFRAGLASKSHRLQPTSVGTHRSLVARTSKCGWATKCFVRTQHRLSNQFRARKKAITFRVGLASDSHRLQQPTSVGTHRSLAARTSKCGWAIRCCENSTPSKQPIPCKEGRKEGSGGLCFLSPRHYITFTSRARTPRSWQRNGVGSSRT